MDATERSRALRRGQTDVERLLWGRLRGRGLEGSKFRRQHPLGRFVTDFCCVERGLVVELDGGQHAVRKGSDELRTQNFEAYGFRVLRFWNNEVLGNMEGVLEVIVRELRHPHPDPLPLRARE